MIGPYIVGLEVFNVLVEPLGQLWQVCRGLKVGGLDEGAPWPDLLPPFGKPFPENAVLLH